MALFEKLMLPIRAVQAVFAIVVLGTEAYVANRWWWHSPSQVNFLIFTSVWTLLAVAYLIITPNHYPAAAHKFGILFAESVTMIFWFAGFIALAVKLTDIGCTSHCGSVWGSAIAGDVFAAFEWLLFSGTTLLSALHCWRTRHDHDGTADPAIKVHTPYAGA